MQSAEPVATFEETPGRPSTVVTRDELERLRTRARWGYGGFAIGIGLGFACTAAEVAASGYHLLVDSVLNLIWAPFLGVVIGQALSRTRSQRPRKWRLLRLRVQTWMVIVAYVALLLGVGISTFRIGLAARQYLLKSITFADKAKVFRVLGERSDTDAKRRRANVAELRDGKIPVGLHQNQREFLQSLEDDPKVTPDSRTIRRGRLTEGEEEYTIRQEQNAVLFGRITDHYERLAAKYEWYRWHPWLPIEPDPPEPK